MLSPPMFTPYSTEGPVPIEGERMKRRKEEEGSHGPVCCCVLQLPSPTLLVFLPHFTSSSFPFSSLSSAFSSFSPSSFLLLFLFCLLLFPLPPPSYSILKKRQLGRLSGLPLGISPALRKHGREDHLKVLKKPRWDQRHNFLLLIITL